MNRLLSLLFKVLFKISHDIFLNAITMENVYKTQKNEKKKKSIQMKDSVGIEGMRLGVCWRYFSSINMLTLVQVENYRFIIKLK